MKIILSTLLLLAVFARTVCAEDAVAPSPAKPKWTLVKTTDREDKVTYEVLEGPALTSLQAEIKKEEGLFDKAMMMADKAWKADESTKSKMFPRSAIGHRSLEVVASYTSSESAGKALTAMEDKISRAEENKIEADRKREENKAKYNTGNNQNMPKKKDPKKAEAERKGLEDQARNLFTSKLEQLKAGKTDAKEAAPANDNAAGAKAAGGAGAAAK